jgi:hypothetical protein
VLENLEWENETLAMLSSIRLELMETPKQMVRRGETGE